MTAKALTLAAGLLLAGCAPHLVRPTVEIRRVEVPVAVRCAEDPGPTPVFADTPAAIQAGLDIYERMKLILAGRAQRDARLAELEAAVAGCR